MDALKPHKFAELLPLMTPAEYSALKADIAANGQRDPIMLFQGAILDGRNRNQVCVELTKKPDVVKFEGTEADALRYVYSKAVHRNMSDSQKAAAAVNFLPHFEKEANSRQKSALPELVPEAYQKFVAGRSRELMDVFLTAKPDSIVESLYRQYCLGGSKIAISVPGTRTGTKILIKQILDKLFGVKGEARDFAGSLFGVSGRYVQDAKAVFERDPKLFRQVFEGSLPLTRATRQIKSRARTTQLKKMAEMAPTTGEATITTGDCVEFLTNSPAKCYRLIFSDPPYNIGVDYGKGKKADLLTPEKYLDLIGRYVAECMRTLTNDGSLWLMICDEWAAEFSLILKRNHFAIRSWIKWYETFGNNCSNNFNRTSRHLFYCVKEGAMTPAPVFNHAAFNRPSDRQAKYNDPRAATGGKLWDDVWQIPRLVENSKERISGFPTQIPLALVTPIVLGCSEPGDTIFDGFTGSGTTAVAAVLNGRKFSGTEISKEYVEMARLRVRAALAEASKK